MKVTQGKLKRLSGVADRNPVTMVDLIGFGIRDFLQSPASKAVPISAGDGGDAVGSFLRSLAFLENVDTDLASSAILAPVWTPSPLVSASLTVGVFDEDRSSLRIKVVSSIAADVVKRLLRDPGQLYRISAAQFEELIMDRLSAMGYVVFRVGNTYQGDGGVDFVFRPRPGDGLPFLGAVQVKHHAKPNLKSDVQVIRDMEGVLSRHRNVLNLGFVVTNTSFTSEAEWYVKPLKLYLRARDGKDVRRWIEGDFSSESEEREVPQSIQLTSKLILELNRKK